MGSMGAAGVGLFLVATAESYNIFSAMTSSPWTAQSFAADERKAAAMREYVAIAVGANTALGVGASLLAGNWWPLLGTIAVSLFMWWIYWRALKRGLAENSKGWAG